MTARTRRTAAPPPARELSDAERLANALFQLEFANTMVAQAHKLVARSMAEVSRVRADIASGPQRRRRVRLVVDNTASREGGAGGAP